MRDEGRGELQSTLIPHPSSLVPGLSSVATEGRKRMSRVTIERMSHDDVPAVMAVDHLCFPSPWSENAYRSEMGNVSAYYLVARLPVRAWGAGAGHRGRLIGYAGAWIVVDE